MEDKCPFYKVELQVHDYYNGKMYDYYEGKLCCPECGFILNKDDYYTLTRFGYEEKPKRKPVFNPYIRFEKKLNQILKNIELPEKYLIKANYMFRGIIEMREKIRAEKKLGAMPLNIHILFKKYLI